MDDYGRPLDPGGDTDTSNPRNDEGRRHNVGIISEWFEKDQDYTAFMEIVKPGDLLEFQREGYCHWVVFIGDYALACQNDQDLYQIVPCIVHRANPTDSESIQNIFSSSKSLSKGVHGIGAVVIEPLIDVWSRSKVRINNGLDNTLQPYASETIVKRALSVANGENSLSFTAYNVVSNNCEHFASWCRSGWNISCQVAKRGEQVLKMAMMAGATLMPRPLAALGGLAVAGLHLVGQMRRASDNVAASTYDHFSGSDNFDDVRGVMDAANNHSNRRYLKN